MSASRTVLPPAAVKTFCFVFCLCPKVSQQKPVEYWYHTTTTTTTSIIMQHNATTTSRLTDCCRCKLFRPPCVVPCRNHSCLGAIPGLPVVQDFRANESLQFADKMEAHHWAVDNLLPHCSRSIVFNANMGEQWPVRDLPSLPLAAPPPSALDVSAACFFLLAQRKEAPTSAHMSPSVCVDTPAPT